jgi:hypothetical protein
MFKMFLPVNFCSQGWFEVSFRKYPFKVRELMWLALVAVFVLSEISEAFKNG